MQLPRDLAAHVFGFLQLSDAPHLPSVCQAYRDFVVPWTCVRLGDRHLDLMLNDAKVIDSMYRRIHRCFCLSLCAYDYAIEHPHRLRSPEQKEKAKKHPILPTLFRKGPWPNLCKLVTYGGRGWTPWLVEAAECGALARVHTFETEEISPWCAGLMRRALAWMPRLACINSKGNGIGVNCDPEPGVAENGIRVLNYSDCIEEARESQALLSDSLPANLHTLLDLHPIHATKECQIVRYALQSLARFQSLTSLGLWFHWFPGEASDGTWCRGLEAAVGTRLACLELVQPRVDHLTSLACAPNLVGNLEQLSLRSPFASLDQISSQFFPLLGARLRCLALTCNGDERDKELCLDTLKQCSSLRRLMIRTLCATIANPAVVCGWQNLELLSCRRICLDHLVPELLSLPRVARVRGGFFTDEAPHDRVFAALSSHKLLRSVDFVGAISKGLISLPLSSSSSLRRVSLDRCPVIDPPSLLHLCSGLQHLELILCDSTDDRALGRALQSASHLRSLTLDCCHAVEGGFAAGLRYLRYLEDILLKDCSRMTLDVLGVHIRRLESTCLQHVRIWGHLENAKPLEQFLRFMRSHPRYHSGDLLLSWFYKIESGMCISPALPALVWEDLDYEGSAWCDGEEYVDVNTATICTAGSRPGLSKTICRRPLETQRSVQ